MNTLNKREDHYAFTLTTLPSMQESCQETCLRDTIDAMQKCHGANNVQHAWERTKKGAWHIHGIVTVPTYCRNKDIKEHLKAVHHYFTDIRKLSGRTAYDKWFNYMYKECKLDVDLCHL